MLCIYPDKKELENRLNLLANNLYFTFVPTGLSKKHPNDLIN